MRRHASSPDSASSALITSKLSRMSCSESATACAPRLGVSSISPSAASTRNASRNGVRETPRRSHSARSFKRAPGAISPSMISSRSRSATEAGSVVDVTLETLIWYTVIGRMSDCGRDCVGGIGSYTIRFCIPAVSRAPMIPLTSHPSGRHFLQIPGPTNVPDRVLRAIDQPTIDHRGPEFAVLGKGVLAGMKKVFRTEGDVVIYPSSGTGAWEAALVNTLSPGDRVLMAETESKLVADSAHAIKAVCVVHNETSTGVTTNVPSIRAAIDRAGHPALFMVDTISSLASIDYRHDAWGVDVT